MRPMAPVGARHPSPVSGDTRQTWRLDEHEAEAIVRRARRRSRDDTSRMWNIGAAAEPTIAPVDAPVPAPLGVDANVPELEPQHFEPPEVELEWAPTLEQPSLPHPPATPVIPWVMATPTVHRARISDVEERAATERPLGRALRRVAGWLGLG